MEGLDGHVDWLAVLSAAMLLGWTFIWIMYLTSMIYGKMVLHKKVRIPDDPNTLPGVSIAKPLCAASSDPNLIGNLTSYFHLDYPKFQIFFCVEDEEDLDLIKIVKDLISKHPNIDAHLCVGARDLVTNPKVSNMIQAFDKAKYPFFWISDARIKTRPDTLTDMVNHMNDGVGLVHQVPLACDGDLSFSRQLEQLWFGGAHSRVYMTANAYGFNVMTGMSCMVRKKILEEEGGLHKLGKFLGEDFFLGLMVLNKGWRIVLSTQPAYQNCGRSSIQYYQGRMKRWMYVRNTQKPSLIFLEPMQEHIFLGPLTSLAAFYLFNIAIYISLPLHFLCALLADYTLLTIMQNKRPAYSVWSFAKAWAFREVSPLYMIPQALRTKSIVWAGKSFIVRYGGLAERVPDSKQ